MVHLITASKDASVYQLYPNKNTGLDEILQISCGYNGMYERDVAKSFLKFDVTNLPSYVTSSNATLHLQLTEVEELPVSFSLYAYPVSESWGMGVGTWPEDINTDGITWNNQPIIDNSTYSSQYFDYQSADINMDISTLLNYWTGSDNFGMMVSFHTSSENDGTNYGYLKYYSKETNTYKQPLVKISWDDQSFITGSLTGIDSNEIIVKTKNLRGEYPMGKICRIDLTTRNRYPVKTFSNSFGYRNMNYLPTTSYYSIEDKITKNTIIQKSEYTKISCDGNGAYVKIDTSNFPTNRPLYIKFYVDRNGIEEIYEDDLSFIVK